VLRESELRYPHDYAGVSDAASVWATHQEFGLRWRRYRVHRAGLLGAGLGGVVAAMERFRIALVGDRGV
jgi:hypothetical protein